MVMISFLGLCIRMDLIRVSLTHTAFWDQGLNLGFIFSLGYNPLFLVFCGFSLTLSVILMGQNLFFKKFLNLKMPLLFNKHCLIRNCSLFSVVVLSICTKLLTTKMTQNSSFRDTFLPLEGYNFYLLFVSSKKIICVIWLYVHNVEVVVYNMHHPI